MQLSLTWTHDETAGNRHISDKTIQLQFGPAFISVRFLRLFNLNSSKKKIKNPYSFSHSVLITCGGLVWTPQVSQVSEMGTVTRFSACRVNAMKEGDFKPKQNIFLTITQQLWC